IESISDDEIRERTSAMFAEYALTAGDFSAAAGIRYEHTGTQYYRFGVFSHEQSNRYRGWYPSLSARYSKGRTSCRMGYTTGTQRPAYENLTGNRLYEDEHIYEGGNPLLRFSKVHTLSLEAQHGGITMLCTYADVHNDVAWIDRIYGGKAILYTPVNIQRRKNLHLMLTYSERIGRWHPRYSAGMSRQIFDLSQEGITARMDKPYWTFKFSNTFYLPGGIHAALRYDCTTAGNELTAYNRARHALSLTMHKTFLADRLSVRIKAADIFKTYRNSGIYRGAYMTVDRKAYTDTRFISLTVSYRFNTTDSKYKGTGAGESEKGRL
ncbi:outer membrane beta-barrel family protein, partial [Hoylesella oralis]